MRTGLRLIALMGVVGVASMAWGQEQELTMEQWQQRVTACQSRQSVADSTMASIDQNISTLGKTAASADSQFIVAQRELYDLIGVANESEIADYLAQLDQVNQQLRGIQSLGSAQIYARRDEIDQIDSTLQDLKQNRISGLPEARSKIQNIESLIAQLRAVRPPPPRTDRYTVVRGDNLWNISKMGRHYGDPGQWPKIFSANMDQIKDPDLIYAQWVLSIPKTFGQSQYVVNRGDFLYGIATQVYGDPGQWLKLWHANEDQINRMGGDQHTIYPYMILDVPR